MASQTQNPHRPFNHNLQLAHVIIVSAKHKTVYVRVPCHIVSLRMPHQFSRLGYIPYPHVSAAL